MPPCPFRDNPWTRAVDLLLVAGVLAVVVLALVRVPSRPPAPTPTPKGTCPSCR